MTTASLEAFNAAPRQQGMDVVLACAAVPRWAAEVCDGRPYADAEQAMDAARTAALPWTEQEVDAALADHPRIGERAQSSHGARSAQHSQAEQAGVDSSDDEVARRLAEGNRVYEERFGHVFLIRAAGRSASQILAALEQRLTHDPQTERRIAAEQLREIAVLRLQGELA